MIIEVRGDLEEARKKRLARSVPKVPWWVGRIVSCPDCGCQFKLESPDPVARHGDPDHDHSLGAQVNCPNCSRECVLYD